MFAKLFNNISLIERGLDASWVRNESIANNIANIDTPGFKSSHVVFEDIMKEAVGDGFVGKTTREKHIPIGGAQINDVSPYLEQDNSSSMRLDGNNVDIDSEMSELAKNTIYYNMLTLKISKELGKLRMAINEGK